MTQNATPLIGLAANLKIGTQGGSPTYTAINGIKSVKAPAGTWGTEDVTVLNTSGNARKFIKTLEEAGELDVSLLWESADPGQAAVLAAYAMASNSTNGADYPFELFLPVNTAGGQVSTGDEIAFSGLVVGFTRPEVQVDKPATWSFKVKVDGAVTVTLGS